MNANPTPEAPPAADARPVSGLLPHWGVIRFAGADAASFLQGQVSNDTRRLTSGAPLLAAYSSPQGRVVAVMHLLPHSSGILALLPAEIVLPTLERLRKFVMRAKVQIADVSDQFAVAGCHGADALRSAGLEPPASASDSAPSAAYTEQGGIGIARRRADDDRYWVVGGTEHLGQRGLIGAASVEPSWRLADIRSGSPQVYAATREMFVAQMLNLDLIDGISFNKGCYTGQEIIARTQHLGRIKRRLFRLRLPPGTWAIGQAVHLRDGRSGRLTELASTGDGIEALAVLSIGAGAPAEETAALTTAAAVPVAGESSAPDALVDATELPLPYALCSKPSGP